MMHASQLSRRMVRGFAAALALIAGVHVISFAAGSMLDADERARLSEHATLDRAGSLVARVALLASEMTGAGAADLRERLRNTTAELEDLSSRLPGPAAAQLAELAASSLALSAAQPGASPTSTGTVLRAQAIDALANLDAAATRAAEAAGHAGARAERMEAVGLLSVLAAVGVVAVAILRPLLSEVMRVTRALEEAREQLAHSALHDHLTGLPNRRYVEEHLRRTLAAASRSGEMVAVLQIDLDGFKQINDRFGHAVGDSVLVAVARRMSSVIRRADFLGRIGGDEFVVVATEARNPRGLANLARRLTQILSQPIEVDAVSCTLGASVGIALSPPLDAEPERLLSQADAALYAAKAEGRGLFRFHPDAQVFLDVHYPKMAPAIVRGMRAV